MTLELDSRLIHAIQLHGERAYPEEGAGLLLGTSDGYNKRVAAILDLPNTREEGTRHNRYLLTPQDYLHAEQEAARLGLDVIGVFHSHPDHPNQPSEFDRDWAMPWFSYLITSIASGRALASRSWRLLEDRSAFIEEPVQIIEPAPSSA